MDRFRELTAFVAVAERGAFNAAARQLQLSPAAVTRSVTALESRLGVRLFTRTTRQTALTEAGRRLLEDAARILTELEAAEASAAGAHDAPKGMLRLTAPVLFGQRFVMPIVRTFLDQHPDVRAEVVLLDRVANLIDEGFDLAVRIGPLPDSTLTATRVGAVRLVTLASPAYLARAGTPEVPSDLDRHGLIQSSTLGALAEWAFEAGGTRQRVRFTPRLTVNTMTAAIDAAAAGFGLVRALSYQVADHLEAGTLVEVLAAHEDREMPIHLVHAEGRRAAAKIRVFLDLAAQVLRRDADRLAAR